MKIGRNDPCICGSSKKYKRCCINKQLEGYRKVESKENRFTNGSRIIEFHNLNPDDYIHIL